MLTVKTDSLQTTMDCLQIEEEDTSGGQLGKRQSGHVVKNYNCLNQLITAIYGNMEKPKPPVNLKITDEKVLELLQPVRYKPSTVI